MTLMTSSDGKAGEIAREIAGNLGIDDVENMFVHAVDEAERHQLMAAIDPEYKKLAEESDALIKRLEKLKGKAGEDASRFIDIEHSRRSNEGRFGFHLGYAAALRLLGAPKKPEAKSPFEVAREAIEEAYGDQISELHYTIQNELKPGATDNLYLALNPRYAELDDLGQAVVHEDAAFILGIAFAQHLKGGRP